MTTWPTSLTRIGTPLLLPNNDFADIVGGFFKKSQAAHIVKLATLRVEAAAGVGIVRL